MDLFSQDFVLENKSLFLRPSRLSDESAVLELADPQIWTHSSTNIHDRSDVVEYLKKANSDRNSKIRQQFTIVERTGNKLIGCSSFENVSTKDGRLEIGWTWLGLDFQGKGFNTIAKFLMLRHVFENMKFNRVEFRIRGSNIQSQKAVTKIGGRYEGCLRDYFVDEGRHHDMIYYSILANEWPVLKSTVFKSL